MHSEIQLLKMINRAFEAEDLKGEPVNLFDPIDYIMSLGGKRIRPVLLLMACEMFGGDPVRALPAAMGVEMFHNFSLVHDDIMDRAPLRRGKPTVHVKWSPNTAILSGDTMLTMAYSYFLRLEKARVISSLYLFGTTAKEVCMGQQMDMDFETAGSVTVDQYIEMIRLKTAVLLGASLKLGGIVAGAGEKELDLIYRYGILNGLVFQLRDDLLDVYGDEKVFGKRQYGDIITNKKTFLYIKAYELADKLDKDRLRNLFSGQATDPNKKVNDVLSIFNKLDIKKITEENINEFHSQATMILEKTGANPKKKKVLAGYMEKLVGRHS